jgi:hypothetical protein
MYPGGWRPVAPARRPAGNELEVLLCLASTARPADRDATRCQVEHALVTEDDECGSLVLAVDPATCPRLAQNLGFVSNAMSQLEVDGGLYDVILHVRNGYIHLLEVYRKDDQPCHGLPRADQLTYLGG